VFGLKLLLIAAMSLFVRARGGAGVQVARCARPRVFSFAQCWWSGGRVQSQYAVAAYTLPGEWHSVLFSWISTKLSGERLCCGDEPSLN